MTDEIARILEVETLIITSRGCFFNMTKSSLLMHFNDVRLSKWYAVSVGCFLYSLRFIANCGWPCQYGRYRQSYKGYWTVQHNIMNILLLTRLLQFPHLCALVQGNHWFRYWFAACSVASSHLNLWWLTNHTPRHRHQWNNYCTWIYRVQFFATILSSFLGGGWKINRLCYGHKMISEYFKLWISADFLSGYCWRLTIVRC